MDNSNTNLDKDSTATQEILEGENKSKKKRRFNTSIYLGMFWLVSGLFLFINNLVVIPSIIIALFLFTASAYLIILSIKAVIPKFYFVLGLVIFAIFFGSVVVIYSGTSLLWPVIMGVLGIGVILYGLIFKKNTMIKYLISGIVLLLIDLMVFLAVIDPNSWSLSKLLVKSWPVILIFLGVYQIYAKIYFNEKSSDESEE